MPIAIEAVSKEAFAKWAETARTAGLEAAYERLARRKRQAPRDTAEAAGAGELTLARTAPE